MIYHITDYIIKQKISNENEVLIITTTLTTTKNDNHRKDLRCSHGGITILFNVRKFNPLNNIIMLNLQVIGNLGSDATVREANGKSYTMFRVAHSDAYTRQDGTTVNQTTWVSCIMSGARPNLMPYLKRGQRVFIEGQMTTRIYDSAQYHCKMVSVEMNVRSLELIGTREQIPSRLYTEDGEELQVTKEYKTDKKNAILKAVDGTEYKTDGAGIITPDN